MRPTAFKSFCANTSRSFRLVGWGRMLIFATPDRMRAGKPEAQWVARGGGCILHRLRTACYLSIDPDALVPDDAGASGTTGSAGNRRRIAGIVIYSIVLFRRSSHLGADGVAWSNGDGRPTRSQLFWCLFECRAGNARLRIY